MVLAPTPGKDRIADIFCNETELGFVQKSRSINDLERIQAQKPIVVLICG
jgi:hypothetical protein